MQLEEDDNPSKGYLMNEPVLVRSSMKTWDLLLLVGFGIAAVIGGYVTCELGWKLEGIVALVAGVFGAFLGAAALQFRVLRRQWIEVE
ncbi:MAG: hypothetical protein FJ267_11040, partial [Planctomycetes bacterium]|nr:hypothetical protein [Planctomycetota bacterium]